MVRELTEKNLIYQLRQYKVKRRVQFFPETESTNTVAKKLCNEGKGAGALIVADCQTAGRGRLGRTFCSPKGTGIYVTPVYELHGNEKNMDLISPLAGLAVRDTLYNMFGLETTVKWPNDVLYEGKKLCGILCEIVNVNNRPKYVVVGVGLNVQPGAFPDDVACVAGAISEFYQGEIDRNELCVELVHNMDRYIQRTNALTEDNKEVIDRLKACSATLGQMVRVILPEESYDARVLDIAPNGGLLRRSGSYSVKFCSGHGTGNPVPFFIGYERSLLRFLRGCKKPFAS